MKSILVFTGSNSSNSVNRILLELAMSKVHSLNTTGIDLRNFPVPMYSMDIEEETGIPSEVKRLKKLFTQHDGFMISSPEHNGMIPAFFKNIMDWLSRTEGKIFQQKPVMLMSTSPGPRGGVTNLGNMEKVFPHWGASAVFADFSLGSFYQNFDMETGTLINPEDDQRLIAAVHAFEAHFQAEHSQPELI
ncbi:MAG: NAD(P)H-dependent oxidoreductase [Pontiella sp.]